MKIDVLVCCTSYPVFKDRIAQLKRTLGVALYDLSRSALLFYQAGNGMSIDFLNFFQISFFYQLRPISTCVIIAPAQTEYKTFFIFLIHVFTGAIDVNNGISACQATF